jgi:YD repeat-containing protein
MRTRRNFISLVLVSLVPHVRALPPVLEEVVHSRELLESGEARVALSIPQVSQNCEYRWAFAGQQVFLDAGSLGMGELYEHDRTWRRAPGGGDISVSDGERLRAHAIDLRPFGLFPTQPVDDAVGAFREQFSHADISVRRRGPVTIVTANVDEGMYTWELDERAGGQPVRCILERDGDIVAECRVAYELRDGFWFPARAEFRGGDQDGKTSAFAIWQVRDVTVNRPEHARQLTPAKLGVRPGDPIDFESEDGEFTRLYWDGFGLVTRERMRELRAQGAIPVREATAAPASGRSIEPKQLVKFLSFDPPAADSLWEAYVREFCDRLSLDMKQRQRAYRILRDCQGQAAGVLRANTPIFEHMKRELSKYRDAEPATAADIRALQDMYRRIMHRLDEIRDLRLRPRLQRLLTTAQQKLDVEQLEAVRAAASR